MCREKYKKQIVEQGERMTEFCGHPVTAAIFDMDGTILDSSAMWDDLVAAVMKQLHYTPKSTIYEDTFPLGPREIAEFLKKDYQMVESVEEIYSCMDTSLKRYYFEEAQLKPGARELLTALHEAGVHLALATATSEEYVIPAMELTGLKSIFDSIITVDKLGMGKSEPQFFRYVLGALRAEANQTVLFEDALYSIQTAKKVGILTCGVYDVSSALAGNAIKDTADWYLSDLMNWRELPITGWEVSR